MLKIEVFAEASTVVACEVLTESFTLDLVPTGIDGPCRLLMYWTYSGYC